MNYFLEVTAPFLLAGLGSIFLFFRLFHQFTGKQMFKIASPCSKHWSELKGDSKKRFCDLCNKSVHNVCNISRAERKVLLDKVGAGESVCIYIEPPFIKRAGYFAFALIMCVLAKSGYNEYRSYKSGKAGGILGGPMLDETKFADFSKINQ